jgi:glycosyltransferase involved in cell wall biosynthesis
MRVLLVTHRFPPDGVGGVERYVERLAAGLAAAGDEVTVLARQPRRFPRRPALTRDSDVWRITGSGVRLEEFLVGSERTEQLFTEVCDEVRPEVVHVHHFIGLSPRIVAIAQRSGAPVAWSLHDYYAPCPLVHLVKRSGEICAGPDEGEECARTCFAGQSSSPERWPVRYRYFSAVLGAVQSVLCPSERLAQWALLMQPAAHVTRLPLGVHVAAGGFRPSSESRAASLRLTFLGTVAAHKGALILADAIAAVEADVAVTVAGRLEDPSLRAEVDRRSNNRVRWWGECGSDDLSRLFSETDVLVAPSQAPEGFPLAPREALAHRVPVIGSRLPGIEDVVIHERNGLLVDPFDVSGLATAIEAVAHDRQLLDQLALGARHTHVLAVDEHVAELQRVYAGLKGAATRSSTSQLELEYLHIEALAAGFGMR